MGDSDDDGDYKRRDKFRTERRGYDGSVDRGISPRHERPEWRDSRGGGSSWGGRERRGGYNDGGGGGGGGYRRERYPSPPGRRHGGGDLSPPHKRIREGSDWDDRYEGYGGHQQRGGGDYYHRGHAPHQRSYSAGGGAPGGGAHTAISARSQDRDGDLVQPPMMTFKSFLTTQDDGISDEEAIKKYGEYKLEFKRQQLNEFFVSHKDEEWFKLKYHPEESAKRKGEQKSMLSKRVDVFTEFLNQKKFDQVTIDGDQTEQLIKLLDSAVIMLEGGTEFDLQVLEKSEGDKKAESEEGNRTEGEGTEDGAASHKVEVKEEASEDKTSSEEKGSEPKKSDDLKAESSDNKGRKRKRTKEFDDESSEESSSDEEELPPGKEKKEKAAADVKKEEPGEVKQNGDEEGEDTSMTSPNGKEEKEEKENGKIKEEESEKPEKVAEEIEEGDDRPRALHRTTSIFLRNLAPTITKQEVEAMCRRYPGFLRAAISDPQPERRWFRRGWVTFERNAKIKEICYSFNNIRLRDCELGPIVNRDLSRRIRTVSGLTVDKKVVRNDIRLAAKVITNLDKKWGIWCKETQDGEELKKELSSDDMMGLVTNNPLLSNITDYLIEEASAEEEELLGKNNDLEEGEEGEDGNTIVRDEELVKVLDRLLFYLRIVHSVDYYNHSEYPNEDEMPNRCGIMHARATIQVGGKAAPFEIEEYCSTFEKKMGSFLQPRAMLTDDDAAKLGMKNEEDEVEKFVQANTQELGKDKWLCPLSGKKFKGPDFVRKHIFNKHGEKVEEVKKEVKYYNNYLKDPRRPQLPENPQNKAASGGSASGLSRHPSQRELGGGHAGGRGGYHYSGYPREATSYPVYEDTRADRSGYERSYDRGGYRGRGGPRYDNYAGRGGRVRDRMGAGPVSAVRMTQVEPDPRAVIDYSDVDFSHEAESNFF